jgi:hypothetical protein
VAYVRRMCCLENRMCSFFFPAAATEEKQPDVKAKVLSSPFRRGKVE